jgi:uncharacterized protein
VTPKSSRDAIEGIEITADGHALTVRVRAVPDKGAANTAVIETVAKWLGVAKRTVTLDAGATSRVKLLSISGDPAALAKAMTDKLKTETIE